MPSSIASFTELTRSRSRANKPNYLGSPRVVQSLFKPLLDFASDNVLLLSSSGSDPDGYVRKVISAMTDDPNYTRMPWHSREELGTVLISVFNLSEGSNGGQTWRRWWHDH